MKTYHIKLKPLEPFFFGGEQTFNGGTTVSYFAKSNRFPQQTTLLGMLRKQVLIEKGIYKENFKEYTQKEKEKIRELIGDESFTLSDEKHFGVIESLSPVFIARENGYYIPAPLDTKVTDGQLVTFGFKKNESAKSYTNTIKDFIPCFTHYKAKDGLNDCLVAGDNSFLDSCNVYKKVIKAGITKDKGESDKETFYKQEFYEFENEGYAFAFFATVNSDLNRKAIVTMGGENSSFLMTTETSDQFFHDISAGKGSDNKIILLSDTFIPKKVTTDIYNDCEFAVTETLSFKNIRYTTGDYSFSRGKKSDKCTFLKRGSVLYVEPSRKRNVESKLENRIASKIGYNLFI